MSQSRLLQDKTFLLLLIAVSVAFVGILWPFAEAVFWGAVLAILFAPVYRRILGRMPARPNCAALLTMLLVLLVAILPLAVIMVSLVREGAQLYQLMRSGDLDVGQYLQHISDALPPWMSGLLKNAGIAGLDNVKEKLSEAAMQLSRLLAAQAVSIGQNTLQFLVSAGIMLYLLFFLLRDGKALSQRLVLAIPLTEHHKSHLLLKFTTVVRATVKGNIAVAAVQGLLGGLIFWVLGIQGALLWGVIMGFLSLLPAIGSALVWAPVALYFLLTGAIVNGVILILFCVLVIGMVDNVLRPVLVGKETKLPDYLVLISTLGGMSLFGLNGFVIGPLIAALFIACWDLFSPRDGVWPH